MICSECGGPCVSEVYWLDSEGNEVFGPNGDDPSEHPELDKYQAGECIDCDSYQERLIA